MKKSSKLFLLSFLAAFAFGCKEDNPIVAPTDKEQAELSSEITSNLTLKANTVYNLKNFVYVRDGATLTIEPGTVIKGDKDTKGTLIIERGAKIMAEGTNDKPIVFTSSQPAGSRAPGDWGGIVILGKARHNQLADPIIEGGPTSRYGGSNDADNSGIFRYVRIEFAGIPLEPNREINGLTLGSVGSGTQIDHVQVSFCGDDAFEFFGGTVSPKYLIAYRTTDDMFDTDYGFTGKVQYALGVSDPNLWDNANSGASNGFESDNDGDGSTLTPLTSGAFSNVTIVGPINPPAQNKFNAGAHLKKATSLNIYNSVITGFPKGIVFDGNKVDEYASSGSLNIKNTVVVGSLTKSSSSTAAFDPTAWFITAAFNNMTKTHAELGLGTTAPFMPTTGSMLLTGGGNVAGFENTNFRGAFGTINWTEGWADFDPQNLAY